MNLEDYKLFTPTTALYPEFNEFYYLKLGLKSEAGELIGKVAKLHRGDKTFVEMREGLISELGDICWFISQFNNRTKFFKFTPDQQTFNWMSDQIGSTSCLTVTADRIYDICRDIFVDGNWSKIGDPEVLDRDAVRHTTSHLMTEVMNMAMLLGVTLEELFDNNYEKLTGRQARGTIKGEGDVR